VATIGYGAVQMAGEPESAHRVQRMA